MEVKIAIEERGKTPAMKPLWLAEIQRQRRRQMTEMPGSGMELSERRAACVAIIEEMLDDVKKITGHTDSPSKLDTMVIWERIGRAHTAARILLSVAAMLDD